MEPWVHVSPDTLRDSHYIELLPGRYEGECWSHGSLFLTEEAFGYIESFIEKAVPEYDHYAFTAIGQYAWTEVLVEIERLRIALVERISDDDLRQRFGGVFRVSGDRFFNDSAAHREHLRQMLDLLAEWLPLQLARHHIVSVLGM